MSAGVIVVQGLSSPRRILSRSRLCFPLSGFYFFQMLGVTGSKTGNFALLMPENSVQGQSLTPKLPCRDTFCTLIGRVQADSAVVCSKFCLRTQQQKRLSEVRKLDGGSIWRPRGHPARDANGVDEFGDWTIENEAAVQAAVAGLEVAEEKNEIANKHQGIDRKLLKGG